ncbi:MAG: NAD-dependent epimerase/dehydratase family protein [Bacteroidota bacterium]
MKVLVTGADGLLGNNLVRELLHRKHDVSVLLQTTQKTAKSLETLPIHRFYGDVLDPTSLNQATQGQDRVIHAAASTQVYPPRDARIVAIKTQGTEHVIQACLDNRVQRLVHIGTANSFGPGTPANPGNEESPYQGDLGLDYIGSKYEAQKRVLAAVQRRGLRALVLNPTFMLGPYDTKPSSGALILALYRGQIPGYGFGSKSYIAVKDVATAAANALDQGRDGECYLLGNFNLHHREAFEILCRSMGVSCPGLPLPDILIKTMGALGSVWGPWLSNPPKLTREITRISCGDHCYSNAKAIRELGLPQTSLEQATQDALAWFKKNDFV